MIGSASGPSEAQMGRFAFLSFVVLVLVELCGVAQVSTRAQTVDWPATNEEATRLLQEYIRIDSSNPPGQTVKTADFLERVLQHDGIPVTRYESSPGRAILYAKLKATVTPSAGKPILLLQHMDVVPADRARWTVDPFGATINAGEVWGRGALDMKGQGVAQLIAFLSLKRLHVPLSRDVILLANPDEEVGGTGGARWMIANHYAELDPDFVIDEGGLGSPDLFATGRLVYGVAVAEKKMMWLKVKAEGVAGHGSQPHDQNPNDRLARGLARLLAEPAGSESQSGAAAPLLETMKARVGTFAENKFTNALRRSTIAVTWIRSGVGDPPKINVIPSVAEAGLDCRVLPGTTREQWIAEVQRRLGDPLLKIEVISESDDPVVTSHDTPLYRNLEQAIMKRHPEAIVTPTLIPYGTDGNAFRPKGVKSYGIFAGVVPKALVDEMHGDAERVPIASVHEAAQILFETLKETLAPR